MATAGFSAPALVLNFGLLLAAPAGAGISYTSLYTSQYYSQTSVGTTFIGCDIGLGINVASPSDFTGGSVAFPGQTVGTPFTPWDPVEVYNGTYNVSDIYTHFTSSDVSSCLAEKNVAFPFGIYAFTAVHAEFQHIHG
jgi:hypothetical protein